MIGRLAVPVAAGSVQLAAALVILGRPDLDLTRGLLEICLRARRQRDVGARPGERHRDRAAEPAGGARDDGDLARERHR